MNKKHLFAFMSAALLVAGSASADDVAAKAGMRGGGGGYGPAGCGLGSLIFKPDSGWTQIFAATTNGTFGNQTFGITTGTSNCDNSSGGSASTKAFVATNRAALSKDIARGRGETLTSLSELAGCRNPDAVGTTLQKNFKRIFPTAQTTDAQVSGNVVDVLKSEPALACGAIG